MSLHEPANLLKSTRTVVQPGFRIASWAQFVRTSASVSTMTVCVQKSQQVSQLSYNHELGVVEPARLTLHTFATVCGTGPEELQFPLRVRRNDQPRRPRAVPVSGEFHCEKLEASDLPSQTKQRDRNTHVGPASLRTSVERDGTHALP